MQLFFLTTRFIRPLRFWRFCVGWGSRWRCPTGGRVGFQGSLLKCLQIDPVLRPLWPHGRICFFVCWLDTNPSLALQDGPQSLRFIEEQFTRNCYTVLLVVRSTHKVNFRDVNSIFSKHTLLVFTSGADKKVLISCFVFLLNPKSGSLNHFQPHPENQNHCHHHSVVQHPGGERRRGASSRIFRVHRFLLISGSRSSPPLSEPARFTLCGSREMIISLAPPRQGAPVNKVSKSNVLEIFQSSRILQKRKIVDNLTSGMVCFPPVLLMLVRLSADK